MTGAGRGGREGATLPGMTRVLLALGLDPSEIPDDLTDGAVVLCIPLPRSSKQWREIGGEDFPLRAVLAANDLPSSSRVTLLSVASGYEAVKMLLASPSDRILVDAVIVVSVARDGSGKRLSYEPDEGLRDFLSRCAMEVGGLYVGLAISGRVVEHMRQSLDHVAQAPFIEDASVAFDRDAFLGTQPCEGRPVAAPSGAKTWSAPLGKLVSRVGNAWLFSAEGKDDDDVYGVSRLVVPALLLAFLPGRWLRQGEIPDLPALPPAEAAPPPAPPPAQARPPRREPFVQPSTIVVDAEFEEFEEADAPPPRPAAPAAPAAPPPGVSASGGRRPAAPPIGVPIGKPAGTRPPASPPSPSAGESRFSRPGPARRPPAGAPAQGPFVPPRAAPPRADAPPGRRWPEAPPPGAPSPPPDPPAPLHPGDFLGDLGASLQAEINYAKRDIERDMRKARPTIERAAKVATEIEETLGEGIEVAQKVSGGVGAIRTFLGKIGKILE